MWISTAGIVSLCALLALSAPAHAEELQSLTSPGEGRNFFSVSPVGGLGFTFRNVGSYAFVYERAFAERHGLVLEGNFIHVHGETAHLWTFGGSLGYRFHLRGLGDSPFFGVSAGYKTGFGKHGHDHGGGGAGEAPSILRLNIRQRSILGNLGYRWVWNSGFHITARMGAGYGAYVVTAPDPGIHAGAHADEAIRASREVLGAGPLAFDTELGFGVRF
jgi:hypothetical protein